MKQCIKCSIEKEDNEFKAGLNRCKDCVREYQKQWRIENKERLKEKGAKYYLENSESFSKKRKDYYQNNKEKIKIHVKQYREDNKETVEERKKNYYQNNKECYREYNKQYREKNKDKISKQRKEHYLENREEIIKKITYYKVKRIKEDLCYKIRVKISTRIYQELRKRNGSKQKKSILQYLPYTVEELKQHLESQFEPWMSWDNWGNYLINDDKQTWHIDHIIPQSLLPYDSMEHPNFQKCWALENLRPLEALENIKKGNKIEN